MSKKSKLAKSQKAECKKAMDELSDIRGSLEDAYSRFNVLTDPNMMDACIFEISALRSRYNYAVKAIKTLYL
ncbi:MAG: DUF2508 family protein [Oscillospiraceae bacterium]